MTSEKPATPAAPKESADVNVRMAQLKEEIETIRRELRSVQGKIKNRDPALLGTLKEENTRLAQRLTNMEKALYGLNSEALLPHDPNEANTKVESLRLAAIEYCKKANVDTSLWKKIES